MANSYDDFESKQRKLSCRLIHFKIMVICYSRATTITTMRDVDFETRKNLLMSEHHQESSLQPYNINLSGEHKFYACPCSTSVAHPGGINQRPACSSSKHVSVTLQVTNHIDERTILPSQNSQKPGKEININFTHLPSSMF